VQNEKIPETEKLSTSMYIFIHKLLNVLVQSANKMGFKRKKNLYESC
jgi:hypothetical protein